MSIHFEGPAGTDLPLYCPVVSVRAMKIGRIEPNAIDGGALLFASHEHKLGESYVKVDQSFMEEAAPDVGDYFVIDGDDQLVFDPFDFEKHYALESESDPVLGRHTAESEAEDGPQNFKPAEDVKDDPTPEVNHGHDHNWPDFKPAEDDDQFLPADFASSHPMPAPSGQNEIHPSPSGLKRG